ncbi:hypothetical protein MY3296_003938 [Beauveria thailandica]
MPLRIMLLAGAPPPSAVDDESRCTVEHFDEPFSAYINAAETHGTSSSSRHHSSSSPASIAPWRLVALHQRPLHAGFSQTHSLLGRSFYGDHQDGDFFCPSSLAAASSSSSHDESETNRMEQDEAVLSEFCEQSLAIHHSLSSSQIQCEEANATTATTTTTTTTTTSFLDETSFLSSLTTPTAGGHQRPPAPNIPPAAHLSDLEDVPSAKHVISLQPQTVTLNMIVGILSIAQPRSVTTRWGTTLSLVEVLLGDDTKSGFAVTFWLAREAMAGGRECVPLLLGGLRRQDVVLLQNVALHVFRGKVYGQSLRRGQTKVHLLWSKRMDARACYSSRVLNAAGDDAGVENPQIAKTRLVRDWVIRFVGADPEVRGRNKDHVWDRPPDDTQ